VRRTAYPFTTPPTTRKRKLAAENVTEGHLPYSETRKVIKKEHKALDSPAEAALPATPQTLLSDNLTMDSDDEMASVLSGSDVEFDEDQDSSVDFGAGMKRHMRYHGEQSADVKTESDNDLDLDDDIDIGFDTQEKDPKPRKKAYEVDFAVYSPDDIQAQQDRQTGEVSNIIGQPPEATAILLRYTRWNKERLIEQYMDKQEEVLDKAGLGQTEAGPPRIETESGFTCAICCDDAPNMQTFALRCGHRFCVDCYRHYLTQKIKDEGEASRIMCPGESCSQIVDSKSLDLLVTADLNDRSVIPLMCAHSPQTNSSQIPGAPYQNIRR